MQQDIACARWHGPAIMPLVYRRFTDKHALNLYRQ